MSLNNCLLTAGIGSIGVLSLLYSAADGKALPSQTGTKTNIESKFTFTKKDAKALEALANSNSKDGVAFRGEMTDILDGLNGSVTMLIEAITSEEQELKELKESTDAEADAIRISIADLKKHLSEGKYNIATSTFLWCHSTLLIFQTCDTRFFIFSNLFTISFVRFVL